MIISFASAFSMGQLVIYFLDNANLTDLFQGNDEQDKLVAVG